ncbi:hypothetical protein KY289_002233 [Solanum tuberosum]|nr:hypothetical protein KY284_004164 [Solanum tuberosum]KAH0731045.1 hypothetical protein KY289_002233 [Solanum tuberosum]
MASGKLVHINAGNGECSYASNSTLQRRIIQEAKPVLEDAIKKLFKNIGDFPKSSCFNMADLGCSSGPNTLFTLSNIIKIVQVLCDEKSCKMPEFQAYLNDLPDNDFNTIFKSIPSFYGDLKDEANCFISGVPGSFYERRLFPSKSLHLVHSSYSLHWLSQAPEKIENNNSIYITRTSPPHVIEAYMKQFDKDFSRFLQLRSDEIVSGGLMVLTFVGRSIPDPYGSFCAFLELLSKSLVDLIHEGLIEQAKLGSFNFPIYAPYKDEVEKIVQMEGSFDVDTIKIFKVNWDERDNDDDICFDAYSSGKHIARTMRAVSEQMLVSHFQFGDSIVDYLFERYAYHLTCHLLVQKGNFFNIVISLTNKK